MKKAVVLIIAVLFLATMLPIAASAQAKGIPAGFASEAALYVHGVSDSDDAEAWQKWQSVHDEDFLEENPTEKYFFLPASAGSSSVDVYNGYDCDVMVNGVRIASHATQAVPYEAGTAYTVDVESDRFTLIMMRSNAEAAIYINNPDISDSDLDLMRYLGQDKSRSAPATGAVVTPDGRIDNTGIKKIKGRGNTSWYKPKKSYNITYDKKVIIPGMNGNKSYAILANYQDDSLSRNRILYDLSDAVGCLTLRIPDMWISMSTVFTVALTCCAKKSIPTVCSPESRLRIIWKTTLRSRMIPTLSWRSIRAQTTAITGSAPVI